MADKKVTVDVDIGGNAETKAKKGEKATRSWSDSMGIAVGVASTLTTAVAGLALGMVELTTRFTAQDAVVGRLKRNWDQAGGSARGFAIAQTELARLGRLAGVTFEEEAIALDLLLGSAKDTAQALDDLALANDIAAGAGLKLEDASRKLTQTRKGEVSELINLQGFTKSFIDDLNKIEDDTIRAEIAVSKLNDEFKDAAKDTKGAQTGVDNLANSLDDLAVAAGGAIAGVDEDGKGLERLAILLDSITGGLKSSTAAVKEFAGGLDFTNEERESLNLLINFGISQAGAGGQIGSLLRSFTTGSQARGEADEALREATRNAAGRDRSTGTTLNFLNMSPEERAQAQVAGQDLLNRLSPDKAKKRKGPTDFGEFATGLDLTKADEDRIEHEERITEFRKIQRGEGEIHLQTTLEQARIEERQAENALELEKELATIQKKRNEANMRAREDALELARQEKENAFAIAQAAVGAAGQIAGGSTGSAIAGIGGSALGAIGGFATGNIVGGITGTIGTIGAIGAAARAGGGRGSGRRAQVGSSTNFSNERRVARIFAEENARLERTTVEVVVNQDFSNQVNLDQSQSSQRRIRDATQSATALALSRARRGE